MSAAVSGAAKRSWRPVGQILLWQVQGSATHGHAPAAMIRGISILSNHGGSGVVMGSDSSSASSTWLYRTVANGFVRPAGTFGAGKSWTPLPPSSASQTRFASGGSALKKEEEPEEHKEEAADQPQVVDSNYWGVTTKTFSRTDGSPWPWNCFRPRDTYAPDVSIDIHKHRPPTTYNEWLAMWFIRLIKIPVNTFYQTRYGCRAMMLETVAAVPGMVGGMVLHLRSLRRFEHSGGWIKALLDEAENERMHLMTLMELVKPAWYERALVVAVQGIFFNVYFILYLISPRLAHRITGYLEEEAVISYTTYLEGIDKGVVENVPAPAIAIDYWRLPPDARLRDMILALRADEAHHRDVNHYAADVRQAGKQLNESPAPVDFH